MKDDELKTLFATLDPVEPSSAFLGQVRSIPLRLPHAKEARLSLWALFGLPSRLATFALSALLGLGAGYLTLEEETSDSELSAFLEIGAHESLFTTQDSDEDLP